MGRNSKIEWCDHTFNPWWGCTRVSPGCDHCYAATLSHRMGRAVSGEGQPRLIASQRIWNEPVSWDISAQRRGVRERVFVGSMCDIMDPEGPNGARERLWKLIETCPNLDWLLLTKRPQYYRYLLPWSIRPWRNVWLGATVENQTALEKRLDELHNATAARRFLSCEPLLGPLNFGEEFWESDHTVDWVIVGGENGPGARPCHPAWVRSIRDQCAAAYVPFFFKGWGEWSLGLESTGWLVVSGDDSYARAIGIDGQPANRDNPPYVAVYRTGKAESGRLLDGRKWSESPASV